MSAPRVAGDPGGRLHLIASGLGGERDTIERIQGARDQGVRRAVYASSSSVYASALGAGPSREDPTTVPMCPYASTKLAGELYARDFPAV